MMLKKYKYAKRREITPRQQVMLKYLRNATSIIVGFSLLFANICLKGLNFQRVYATGDADSKAFLNYEGYANQWARSDIRKWLNGLDENYDPPTSGSGNSESFLDCFTEEELDLFQEKEVTTTMFNEDNADTDDNYSGTISEVVTIDKFWLPSGHYDDTGTPMAYEDFLISVDPSYDLSYHCTYKQKIVNGKENNWKNIVPGPFFGGKYFAWLRSAAYDDNKCCMDATPSYDVNTCGGELEDVSWTTDYCACGYIDASSINFAAVAKADENISSSFSENSIAAYDKLGKKDPQQYYNTPIPSWGMYLKKVSNNLSLDGTLTYSNLDSDGPKLTFATPNETDKLPEDKYLMIQAYKPWDTNKTPTENAAAGDTIYVAGQKIENDNTTSVDFTGIPNDVDIRDYVIKVWVEEEENSLPKVSAPLTFSVNNNGTVNKITETKSSNPRIFAYKNDLACSWGTYDDEKYQTGPGRFSIPNGYTLVGEGEDAYYKFDKNQSYVGNNPTWQKLYIGTDYNGKPIEWFIASRDDNGNGSVGLTVYQNSSIDDDKAFNDSTDPYEGDGLAKNPTLVLPESLTAADLEDIGSKVTFMYDDTEIENIPGEKYYIQYCKAKDGQMTGFEWLSAPDGYGQYYIRVAFAGTTVDGTAYAPCFSPIRLVNVEAPTIAVSSVTLNKEELTLCPGKTETLTATILPDDATDKTITWTSDAENIATVQDGVVTAVAEGEATITATAGGKSANCVVTVEHSYGNVSYNWEQINGNWQCTAKRTCSRCGDEQSETQTEIESNLTTAPTCTTKGQRTLTATFNNTVFGTSTKTVDIAKLDHVWEGLWRYDNDNHWHKCSNCEEKNNSTGHTYENVSYDWKQVNGSWQCTATGTCTECGYVGSEVATINNVVEDVPNWTDSKENVYVATFTKSGFMPQTKRNLMMCNTKLNGQDINCILQDPDNAVPEGAYLKVSLKEPNSERWEELKNQLDSTHPIENIAFFEIELLSKIDDKPIPMPLDSEVRVLLQIPDGWDKSDMEAVLVAEDEDREFEEDIVTIDGIDYVAFKTDHFSPYALIDKLNAEEAGDSEVYGPSSLNGIKTGENIKNYILFSEVLISATAILFVVLKKKILK